MRALSLSAICSKSSSKSGCRRSLLPLTVVREINLSPQTSICGRTNSTSTSDIIVPRPSTSPMTEIMLSVLIKPMSSPAMTRMLPLVKSVGRAPLSARRIDLRRERNGLIMDIASIFNTLNTKVRTINARDTGDKSIVNITLETSGIDELRAVVNRISALPGVVEVNRNGGKR